MRALPDDLDSQPSRETGIDHANNSSGSEVVAEHARQNLHLLLTRRPEFYRMDYEAALRGALADEDALLLERFQDKSMESAICGSTVAICFVNLSTGDLVVGNLGDSRAVLAERDPKTNLSYSIVSHPHISFSSQESKTDPVQQSLTESHKPDMPREKSRIEDAGGEINHRTGTARVGSLNMSRALGDLQYKNPMNQRDGLFSSSSSSSSVSSVTSRTRSASSLSSNPTSRGNFLSNEPYLARFRLPPDRRYVLVIESDGISDYLDDTTLIQFVTKLSSRGHRAGKVAQEVASTTTNRHKSSDNGSCILVLLDGQDS